MKNHTYNYNLLTYIFQSLYYAHKNYKQAPAMSQFLEQRLSH